jgi:twitching motility protein PilT
LKKAVTGRIPAFEILLGSSALSNAIREGKTAQINNQIQTGKSRGMVSMDQSLAELVRLGHVTREMALERAFDREAFRSTVGIPQRETGQTAASSAHPSPTPGAAR